MTTVFCPQGRYTPLANAQAPAVYAALMVLVDQLEEAGFAPRDAGHLISDVLADVVLLRVLVQQEKGGATAVKEALKHDSDIGRAAYQAHVNNATIHSNRFPSWEELSPEARAEWCWKADR